MNGITKNKYCKRIVRTSLYTDGRQNRIGKAANKEEWLWKF